MPPPGIRAGDGAGPCSAFQLRNGIKGAGRAVYRDVMTPRAVYTALGAGR